MSGDVHRIYKNGKEWGILWGKEDNGLGLEEGEVMERERTTHIFFT